MNNRLRIAIPVIGGKHWLGGITYVNALACALKSLPEHKRPTIQLVVQPHDISSLPYHVDILENFDCVILIGEATMVQTVLPTRIQTILIGSLDLLNRVTDFYYPVNCDVLPDVCSAAWIPDFQHAHLPQFFSEKEICLRNESFAKVAAQARSIVFSSRNAEQDFKSLYPASRAHTHILHFHTPIDKEIFTVDAASINNLYRLPAKYIICCNQFWKHKNHLLLFEAIAELRDQGITIPLVCTGSTEDYRFADYFQTVRDTLQRLQISDQVRILGTIPRNHQLQLMRHAAVLVQPSLFEGWSTVVEDGRALGKRMLLSDLDVHKEQATKQSLYFEKTDLQDLKLKLSEIWLSSQTGPDIEEEAEARKTALTIQRRFASKLLELAESTIQLYNRSDDFVAKSATKSPQNLQHLLDSLLA